MAEENAEKEEGGGEEVAAEVQKKGEGGPAPASGPNQKLVFIVLIFNVVAILGVGAIVFIGNSKRSSTVTLADIAAQNDLGAAAAKHGGEHGAPAPGAETKTHHFIKEAFTVNLTGPQGNKYAKVDVEIEVDDDFVKSEIERLRPKIRDFILVVLSSKTSDQIESIDGRNFLREEIKNKINGYLTRGQVKNVFFTQFIVQ